MILQNKKLEEIKYKKLEECYKNIIEISPIGIVIHQDERLIYINSTGAKILETDNEKLIVKSIFDITDRKKAEEEISLLLHFNRMA